MSGVDQMNSSMKFQPVNLDPHNFGNNCEEEQGLIMNRKVQKQTEDDNDYTIIVMSDRNQKQTLVEKFKTEFKLLRNKIIQNEYKFKGVLSIALSMLVLVLHSSLKVRCPFESDHSCLKQFIVLNLAKWITKIFINCIITLFQLHMLIEGSTERIITGYGLIQSIYLWVFNDNVINLHYYMGAMNAVHEILFAFFLVIYVIVRSWIFCFKKHKMMCVVGNILFISIFAYIFYSKSVIHGCDYWAQGINGEIDNTNGTCKIDTPELCWYKITHHWQDVSLLLPTCENSSTSNAQRDIVTKFFQPYVGDSRYIGFSNLNTQPEFNRTDDEIQKTNFAASKGFSSLKEAQQEKHDVVFDRKEMKYNIEIQFNKTLSEERKKIADSIKDQAIGKNILMIFIDSVSRQSMHLKLPKTVEWFEKKAKHHSYKKENKQTESDKQGSQSFEFYKYNSLKPYTFNNLQTLFYGTSAKGLDLKEEDKKISIAEDFKKSGYITSHTSDFCQTIALGFDGDNYKMTKSTRYDHETQSYACDPNYQDPDSIYGLFQGPFSIIRRCLYGKSLASYNFEYAKSFFSKYKDNKKFMHIEFLYGHEGTGEVINYLDDPLSTFLDDMTDSGLLKDTTVILVNDHGLHMHGIFYALHLQNVFVEVNLPGLFINLPQELNAKYGDQVALNQQNLLSVKNLHHFFKHMIYGDKYEHANKSILNNLEHQKFCTDKDVNIQDADCSCK